MRLINALVHQELHPANRFVLERERRANTVFQSPGGVLYVEPEAWVADALDEFNHRLAHVALNKNLRLVIVGGEVDGELGAFCLFNVFNEGADLLIGGLICGQGLAPDTDG